MNLYHEYVHISIQSAAIKYAQVLPQYKANSTHSPFVHVKSSGKTHHRLVITAQHRLTQRGASEAFSKPWIKRDKWFS